MLFHRQIRGDGDRVRLSLNAGEQLLLRDLLDQLEPLLADPDDPALRRLFPPAYSDDESDEQYRSLVRDQLVNGRAKATKLMLQVHNEGKAAVSTGTREKAELDVSRLHAHGLWATMQQD